MSWSDIHNDPCVEGGRGILDLARKYWGERAYIRQDLVWFSWGVGRADIVGERIGIGQGGHVRAVGFVRDVNLKLELRTCEPSHFLTAWPPLEERSARCGTEHAGSVRPPERKS